MTNHPSAIDTFKLQRLTAALDLRRPELAAIAAQPRAEALLAVLARPPRARFYFEYERKSEMLDFLRTHYQAWKNFDCKPADKFATMSLEDARKPRALANIPVLGAAWWATGDEKYGRAFERFYTQSKTGEMFNWGSFNGTQLAVEINAYFRLLDCPGFSDAGRIAFLDHLLAIANDSWDTHTSTWQQNMLGTEGHNWYLHGMHGLPDFALAFPELARSDFFLRSAWSVVEEHVRGHYKSDGGARETTLGYQCGSVRNLWEFYVIARRNGHPVSAGYADTVLSATKFLLRLMSPSGAMPVFGDTGKGDAGMGEVAAAAAAVTGDRECKWYAEHIRAVLRGGVPVETPGKITQGALWIVGLEGAVAYEKVRPRDPQHGSMLMGPTGYAAMRSSNRADASYMGIAAADRGPIVTSHGHNEIFSFDVSADGVRYLGTNGIAPYGTSPGRDYDMQTASHNCLTVAGVEQATLIGEWRWANVVTPAIRRWISEPSHDFFHGVHEGFYTYRKRDLLHARKIIFLKPNADRTGYWIIFDWLESSDEHDYEAYFHGCVPGVAAGQSIVLDGGAGRGLTITPSRGRGLALKPFESEGRSAYLRELSLDPNRCPSFKYSFRSASDCVAWVIAPVIPGRSAATVDEVPVLLNGKKCDPHDALAVRVNHGAYHDVVCVSHKDYDAELGFSEQKSWGHLALRRIESGGVVSLAVDHTMEEGVCGR